MQIDVPAYIQIQPEVRSGVIIQGGTNYDLTRHAVTTPLTRLAPVQAPVASSPSPVAVGFKKSATDYPETFGEVFAAVGFGRDSAVLGSTKEIARLARQHKGKPLVVLGHADPAEKNAYQLASARAKAVAAALRAQGVRVSVKSYGDELALTDIPEFRSENRRVEIAGLKP